MVWARKPVPATKVEAVPVLIGLEINATRARAVHGAAEAVPRSLPLTETSDELPLFLSLQGRQAEVGRAGRSLCRLLPHLTCSDFLASLGDSREWVAGRHRFDALKALTLVFERMQPTFAGAQGLVLTLPAYLSRAQALLASALAEKARLPVLGSVPEPLAGALAAYRAEPWAGLALVVDVDEHAVTAAVVAAEPEQLNLHTTQTWTSLNLRIWKSRLLDAVADRCIRQSRRDPRDCAPAEQALYDQIEDALEQCVQGKPAEFLIQTNQWYQHILMPPDEFTSYAQRLVNQAVLTLREMLSATGSRETLRVFLLTAAAGRLPGLVPALQRAFAESLPPAAAEPSADFGEALLPERPHSAGVFVLAPDAVAQAAHDVAVRMHSGALPRGPVDFSLPLPRTQGASISDPKPPTFRLLSFDS